MRQMPPFLVDSHCHLDFDVLADDLPAVLARAETVGIRRMVTICTRISQFDRVLKIAQENPSVYCSVGTHPHNAEEERGISAERIVALAQHDKVVAIGEAGLDYHYDNASPEAQAEGLRIHIEAARQTGLPLVIHARDADDHMAAILRDEMANGAYNAVLHCFSSGAELAQVGLELGFYVSFSGILTFKSADHLREIAKLVPMDRLLVETDAPYLAPVPHRGKPNQPAFVANTAEVLAGVRGVSLNKIAAVTSANFFSLFARVPVPAEFDGFCQEMTHA